MGHNIASPADVGTPIQLTAAEERYDDPAIALPGQLEKVLDAPHGDLERQLQVASGARRLMRPTILYEIKDAKVLDGSIYVGRGRLFLSPHQPSRSCVAQERDFDEAFVVSSFLGCHFFGHWLKDDLASMLLDVPTERIDVGWPDWADFHYYSHAFQLDARPVARARFRRLYVADDFFQHLHKAGRFRELRARLAEYSPPRRAGHIVYLCRGKSGVHRSYENEAEVVELLASRGVEILQPEREDTAEFISQLLGAKLVVSIEGSQLSHALFTLAEGGGVLTIQPPRHFYTPHKDWADSLGMKFGFIVGDETTEGYRINEDDLLRTIDLMI
jgi:hypothetical protein